MAKSPLAELRHVSVTLQGVQALKDISISICRGEHCALIGPNGAGKSTLLKLLRAECFPDNSTPGKIFWYPDDAPDDAPLAGRELCSLVSIAGVELYLRQQWDISGEELLISGIYDTPLLYSAPNDEERKKARMIAKRLNLTELLNAGICGLSQAQISMLLFARSCMRNSSLLLLDEFIDGLDSRYHKGLLEILEKLSRKVTLLIATHRTEKLPSYMRKIIYMADGKITSTEFLKTPPANDVSQPQAHTPRMHVRARHRYTRGRSVFCLSNVTVYIASNSVLRNIDWKVYPREHWVLVGEAGSGKSSLLRLLAGDYYPAAGGKIERILPGTSTPLRNLADIRRHIRLVSGDMQATYAYDLTGEEFVCSGEDGSVGVYHTLSDADRAQAGTCLEMVDALHLAARRIRSLSTGQLRRLLLARALVGFPKILLLDDPFAGLDINSRARIRELLCRLANERKIQIIMTTPSPRDLLFQSSRAAILRNGRLYVEESTPK